MRIAQAANFVAPASGGLWTAMRELASGYAAGGHEVVQIVPGAVDDERETPTGRLVSVRAPVLPGTGYRVIRDPHRVAAVLDRYPPDRLEVHDRTSLRGLGGWARRRGVPALVVSHERLDRLLSVWTPPPLRGLVPVCGLADRSNRRLAAGFDTVVCTTAWAAAEFRRIGVANLRQVPLGVDLDLFAPRRRDERLRRALVRDDEVLLVLASRLAKEKRPFLAVDALAELLRRGARARLVVAGDGPAGPALRRAARGLPVVFLGFLPDRARLAALLATADLVLAPGPVETFGLAALEALASGTAVVANHASAVGEMLRDTGGLDPAGGAVAGCGWSFADEVARLLETPSALRALAARARAERYPWSAAVAGFLAALDPAAPEARAAGAATETPAGAVAKQSAAGAPAAAA